MVFSAKNHTINVAMKKSLMNESIHNSGIKIGVIGLGYVWIKLALASSGIFKMSTNMCLDTISWQ